MRMKIVNRQSLFLVVVLALWSCGGGGEDDEGGPEPSLNLTLKAPSVEEVISHLSYSTNFNLGIVPGLPLSDLTLPFCTDQEGAVEASNVTYSLSGADWLSVNESQELSLANGESFVPSAANSAIRVTYTCTDKTDETLSDSVDFIINDADGGGVIDAKEYEYRLVPSNLVAVSRGMDVTDPTDDQADFDGDALVAGGGTNAEEIKNGTDPMIFASTGQFNPRENFGTSYAPRSIITADLDADGDLDIAVANGGYNSGPGETFTIFWNTEEEPFSTKTNYNTGLDNRPMDLAAADFNKDGIIDLAIIHYGVRGLGTTLAVHLNQGEQEFSEGVFYTVGQGPAGIVASDLDGDGDVDLATANYTSGNETGTISVLLNNGDGVFAEHVTYDTIGNPASVMAADLDNDEDMDLVVVGGNDTLTGSATILLGNGDGTFSQGTAIEAGFEYTELAVADINKDGNIDLAAVRYDSGKGTDAYLLLGAGDGTFSLSDEILTTGAGPITVALADFEGDGKLDIITANLDTSLSWNTLSILRGKKDGRFYVSRAVVVDPGVVDVAVGDFNGDGKLDLASLSISEKTISVMMQ